MIRLQLSESVSLPTTKESPIPRDRIHFVSASPSGEERVQEGRERRPYLSFFGRLFEQIRSIHFGPYRHGPRDVDEPTPEPPALPLLTHLRSLDATDWLRTSLTTFGKNVSSFLPGDLPAFTRVYHPFDNNGEFSTWREQLAIAGQQVRDPAEAEDFAYHGARNKQSRVGTLALPIIETLVQHLRPATTTPNECFFAIWEGFAGSAVPASLTPKLVLPGRAYHVFTGPLAAALTSYDAMQFHHPAWPHHMSANLWWPADHAWCVATEVDFAWTYVGASRACIDAVLADPRLEAVETSALARW